MQRRVKLVGGAQDGLVVELDIPEEVDPRRLQIHLPFAYVTKIVSYTIQEQDEDGVWIAESEELK